MSDSFKQKETSITAFVKERERLLVLAQSMVGSHAIAEELVQDSWLRWEARDYPEEKIAPILHRIVANLCRDWLRKQKTERFGLQFLGLFQDMEPDTERVVISRQDLELVVKALGELPSRTVTAFYLSRIEGLTLSEIGERLNTSPQRSHQLVRNALVHVAMRMEG
ncbi:MAG: RNA polymerase sigma factor [Pseudomonadota bacterium]